MTTLPVQKPIDTRVTSSPTPRKAKTWLGFVKAVRLAQEQGCDARVFLRGDRIGDQETPFDVFLASHPDETGNLLSIPYTELLSMEEETLTQKLQALCTPTQV